VELNVVLSTAELRRSYRKFIFSSYKEGILNTIEGLSEEDVPAGRTRTTASQSGTPIRIQEDRQIREATAETLYAMYFRNTPYIQ